MNLKQIKALAAMMNEEGLTRVEISEGETVIKLEKEAKILSAPAAPALKAEAVSEAKAGVSVSAAVSSGDREIKSPMVGVFYSASAPGEEPFVSVGSRVKKGDVVCIIEAMKLMNEITADSDGEITEICVSNEQIVEYGQPLFRLR
ncbi:MAG: acetyl-CoA carboxylase biotin carboxyl carrier protein [Clostridia bacterium]|nr:acetyl-CoA carboxylase biotin carboxyl carrier protein [Clostridia bacterium]